MHKDLAWCIFHSSLGRLLLKCVEVCSKIPEGPEKILQNKAGLDGIFHKYEKYCPLKEVHTSKERGNLTFLMPSLSAIAFTFLTKPV